METALALPNLHDRHALNVATLAHEFRQPLSVLASALEIVATAPSSSDEPLWIDGDTARLQQVLSNLIGNAVKYTNSGGEISVSAEPSASGVSVRVSDTGRGLEPDALCHVFDPFSQVRPSEEIGLGIGLSIVKEIVERHHGRIEVRSDGAGCGTSFIITLPDCTSGRLPAWSGAEVTLTAVSPYRAP